MSSVFWDITPCFPVKVNGRFGGIYNFLLQSRKVNHERNKHDVGNIQSYDFFLFHVNLLLLLFSLKMEAMCSSEISLTFTWQHGIISQKPQRFFSACCLFHADCLLLLFVLKMETLCCFNTSSFTGLHGVISHKTEFFINTAVISSNPNFRLKVLCPY
jgi:hypothetical protein